MYVSWRAVLMLQSRTARTHALDCMGAVVTSKQSAGLPKLMLWRGASSTRMVPPASSSLAAIPLSHPLHRMALQISKEWTPLGSCRVMSSDTPSHRSCVLGDVEGQTWCLQWQRLRVLEERGVCQCPPRCVLLPVCRRPVRHCQQPAWRQRCKPAQQHLCACKAVLQRETPLLQATQHAPAVQSISLL